jgi:serine/threonine protein kinase
LETNSFLSEDPRMLYMIMDFEPGGELFSIIQKAGALTPKQAQTIAATLALVFEFCHNQHIVYRDLKPENILIDSMGHAKLTDFGLSKRMAVGEGRTFTLAGTPDYMAPEVIQNTGHGKAADWWTLGILVYEMLTGVPAFYKPGSFDAEATFRRIVTGGARSRQGWCHIPRLLLAAH